MKRFALFALFLLVTGCRSAGGLETQSIDIPYPAGDVTTINLNTTAGQVTINPADGDGSGVRGSLTTNVGAWQATTATSGSLISISQGTSSASVIPDAQNTWDLQLGKGMALILNHSNTGADALLNLGGLTLQEIKASATSGSYSLRYSTPTEGDGGLATFRMTSGSFDATGLADSGLNTLSVTTQGGGVQMSFDGGSGALVRNMLVRIETQVGDVLLKIPDSLPAQVIYRTSSGVVLEVDPMYTKVNDITYSTGNYEVSAAPRLTIEIRTVVGDLRLAGA